jgi:ribosomal protein S18 acetylase RimI-like enzyme
VTDRANTAADAAAPARADVASPVRASAGADGPSATAADAGAPGDAPADAGAPARAEVRARSFVHVEMTTAADPRFAALVAATEVDLAVRYQAAEPIVPLKLDHIVEAVLAVVDGEPVGCVALAVPPDRVADPDAAPGTPVGASSSMVPDQLMLGEVKRLYVTPQARRRGVARALIREVEARAARRGLTALVLETGTAQPEAMALYESLGFHQIANYSSYADDPRSRCYAKSSGRVAGLGAENTRFGPQT